MRWLMYVVILLSNWSCSDRGGSTAKPEVMLPVLAERAVVSERTSEYTYAGEVHARHETAAAFRVGGKIIARYVDVGSVVMPGAPLARIDARDYELSARGAQSKIQAARADYDQARKDFKRFAQLLAKKFISQAEYDRRQNTVDRAKAYLDELTSHYGMTQNQVAYTVLRADSGGVVTAIDAEQGQVVSAGQPVVHLAQPGDKEVVIAVPENQLETLHTASEVRISLWANPKKSYVGSIREISPIADPATRTYTVKVAVSNADDEMRLGMTARVVLLGAKTPPAIYLPLSALYRKNDHTAVWVVDPSSQTVHLVSVTVKGFDGNKAVIDASNSGLTGNEMVVTAGVDKLYIGQKVRLLKSGAS